MNKIEWIQKNIIEKRSRTLRGALLVSIEHHEQIVNSTMLEFFTAVAKKRTAVSSNFCGLCFHQGKANCLGCCLSSIGDCCQEWRDIRRAIVDIFTMDDTWLKVQKAEKKMIRRLKRELRNL